MVSLFMDNPTAAAMQTGKEFLLIVSPFYFTVMVKLSADGIMRGASAVRYFVISTFSDLLLRVALAYILSPHFGSTGIWLSWPIGWILSAILVVVFYIKGYWIPKDIREEELKKVQRQQEKSQSLIKLYSKSERFTLLKFRIANRKEQIIKSFAIKTNF